MARLKKILLWTLAVLMALYVLIGAAAWIGQRKLIYPTFIQRAARSMETCPLPEGVAFWREDGERGVFFDHDAPRLLIMYHGNAETACNWRFLGLNHVGPLGYDVLAVEYPGYGGDDRPPSIAAFTRLTDVVAAWVAEQDYEATALMGYSLGAAVAGVHAERAPDGVSTILLVAPFDRMINAARDMGFWYPRFLLSEDYDNIQTFSAAGIETAILHGDADTLVFPRRSERLAEALREAGVSVSRTLVPGAQHNGYLFSGAHFDLFLETHLAY